MSKLKELNCPICSKKMETRIQNREHTNSVTKEVKKMKWIQYYCSDCNDGDSGWTTEESDTKSLEMNGIKFKD